MELERRPLWEGSKEQTDRHTVAIPSLRNGVKNRRKGWRNAQEGLSTRPRPDAVVGARLKTEILALNESWAGILATTSSKVALLFGVHCVNLSSFISPCYPSSCSLCKMLPGPPAFSWKSNKSRGLQPFSCKCLLAA